MDMGIDMNTWHGREHWTKENERLWSLYQRTNGKIEGKSLKKTKTNCVTEDSLATLYHTYHDSLQLCTYQISTTHYDYIADIDLFGLERQKLIILILAH